MGTFKGCPDILVIWMPSVFAINLQFFYLFASQVISFLQPFEKLAKNDGHYYNFIDKFNINAYN